MGPCEALWLDSDVLLDWLAKREPWNVAALELVERAITGEWEIWFSPLTLANIHYLYRRHAGLAEAAAAIEKLVRIGNIAPMDATHVRQALATRRSDFEDELQIACAKSLSRLSAVITRNLDDYAQAPLPVYTAQGWLDLHPRPVPQ